MVWIVSGGIVVAIGYVFIGDEAACAFPLLLDIAWSWFTLAVGAAYAFLKCELES